MNVSQPPPIQSVTDSFLLEALLQRKGKQTSIVDRHLRYVRVSRGYEEVFGRPSSEIEGKFVSDVLGKEHYEGSVKDQLELCLAGTETTYETWVSYPKGGKQFVQVHYVPMYEKAGEAPSHALVTVIDITKLKLAEEAQALMRSRLESVIAGTHAGTWEWNVTTGEAIFNERWADIAGYTLQELEPISIETWLHLVHPEDREESDSKLQEHFEGKADFYECAVRIRHKNEYWVWVMDRGRVSEWRDGKPYKMYGSRLDISSRMKVEEELREAAMAAGSANEAKTKFLNMMNHEMRTPLNAIIGPMELLETEPLSEGGKQTLSMIKPAATHLLALIDDILSLSKIQAGKHELRMEDAEVRPLLLNRMQIFRIQAENKGLKLNLNIEPEVPSVIRTEPRALTQILYNLVSNAIKFTQKGNVWVNARLSGEGEELPGEGLVFVVADSGVGIPKEHQQRVFEAFQQVHMGMNRIHQGTGLGLTISTSLAALLGGRISVESEDGKGTTFKLWLPLGCH